MNFPLLIDANSTLEPRLSCDTNPKDQNPNLYANSVSTQESQYILTSRQKHIDELLIDNNMDLSAHIRRIFDINDPIRRLYLLYLSQDADITEVEVCLLKEIMCLRTIVVGYLEYIDTWHEHLNVLPLSASFRTLSANLVSRLNEDLSEKLDKLTNTRSIQTLSQNMTSIHTQTLSQNLSRQPTISLAEDSNAFMTSTGPVSSVKLPTQEHNPLIGKVKQLHDLLAEKETRIADLSTELADVRQKLTNYKDSLHLADLYAVKQSSLSRPLSASQDSKLVVKQRSASTGIYTAKSAHEPLAARSEKGFSMANDQHIQRDAPVIATAELVPKTVLVNLHKSITEKDALLAEKCEIINTQQREISWLKEMLQTHELEKEKAVLQSTLRLQSNPLAKSINLESDHPLDKHDSRVSFSMDATTPSRRTRSKKSRTVEAMIDALELESQVMSLKNQIATLPVTDGHIDEAVSRLASLEQELTRKSINLTDLDISMHHSFDRVSSPRISDDDISRLIADHQAVFATVERSLSQTTK